MEEEYKTYKFEESKFDRLVRQSVEHAFDKSRFDNPEKAISYFSNIIKNNIQRLSESELEMYNAIISGIKSRIGRGETKTFKNGRRI